MKNLTLSALALACTTAYAQSGASKSVTQKWRFGRLFPRYYLCGDTGKPTVSERVFAGF